MRSTDPSATTRRASTTFRSRMLPSAVTGAIRDRLDAAHAARPFSPLDPRDAVRRSAALLTEVGMTSTVYRGGLDLRGAEVDHVWLVASGSVHGQRGGEPFVLDAAFPLFHAAFVDVLRRFVAGDGDAEELAAAAAGSLIGDRVVGLVPAPMRYVGAPVWSSRG